MPAAGSAPDASPASTDAPRHPLAPEWLHEPADLNALSGHIWSATAARDARSGELHLGGVAASRLVRDFGSPVMVLDEDDVRGRMRDAARAFAAAFTRTGTTAELYYAGKAFLATTVVRWVHDEGLRLDVASGGELAIALAGGMPPARIGLHGNNKAEDEIDLAVRVGVGSIVLDSEMEIDRVRRAAERHGVRQSVRIRVNSGIHASTHSYLATAHEDQKFGFTLAQVPDVAERVLADPHLDLRGLHSHIGSQIFETGGFRAAAARLLEVQAAIGQRAGRPLPELNLGGGFGIAYVEHERPINLADMAEQLADDIAAECARLEMPVPALTFEPGRALVGPGGTTLYTVGTIKTVQVATADASGTAQLDAPTAERRYISVDGGMSDNARPALYGADYTVRLANRTSASPASLVRVVGKHCEAGDIVVHADFLPADVVPGDLLAVPATGAYCASLASNYNAIPRPAVVGVRDGMATPILYRERIEDLLRRDAGVHHGDRPHTPLTDEGAEHDGH